MLVGYEGGPRQKIWLQKGGGHQKNTSKFGSDSICNNANMSARRPKIAFLRF